MYIRILIMIILGLVFGLVENYVSVPDPTLTQAEYQELYDKMSKKEYLTEDEMNFLVEKGQEYITNTSLNDNVVDPRGFVAIAIFLLFMIVPFHMKSEKRLIYSVMSVAAFFCAFFAFTSFSELIVYCCFAATGVGIAYVGLWGMKKI